MGAEQLQIELSPSPEPPEQIAAAAAVLICRRSGGLRHRFRSPRFGFKRRGHTGLIHSQGLLCIKDTSNQSAARPIHLSLLNTVSASNSL